MQIEPVARRKNRVLFGIHKFQTHWLCSNHHRPFIISRYISVRLTQKQKRIVSKYHLTHFPMIDINSGFESFISLESINARLLDTRIYSYMRDDLHWLPASCGIKCKMELLIYNCFPYLVPHYLIGFWTPTFPSTTASHLSSSAQDDLRITNNEN